MIFKHVGRSFVIFGSIPKAKFLTHVDVFLDLVILTYVYAISLDFCVIKCLIYINFV